MDGSITIISGTLGGGKTLCAVERMYEHVRRGGYAFTNIQLHREKWGAQLARVGFIYEDDRVVDLVGDLGKFHERVGRGSRGDCVMVVIDEAHLSFNARDWDKANRDLLNFNTLVRKLDIELIYITQDPNNLDKQFRRMVQNVVVCRNMKTWKVFGLFNCPIPLMFRIHMDMTRGTGTKGTRNFTEIIFRRQWVCDLYNSDALLGAHAQLFSGLKQFNSSPLKRIEKSKTVEKKSFPWAECLAALCAAIFTLF